MPNNYKFKIPNSKFQRAFTLVELIVVIGIIGLVFAGGFSNFRDFDRRQRLSQAGSTLRKDLELAKTKAFSSEKPSGCTTTLAGWRVTFATASYDLIADCDVNDVTFKTVSFPSGITKTAGAASVTFAVLARGTTSAGDDTFTLTQNGTNSTTDVTVTRSGTIYPGTSSSTSPPASAAPTPITCTCDTPGGTTPNNHFTCTDGDDRYCAWDEYCTSSSTKPNWPCALIP